MSPRTLLFLAALAGRILLALFILAVNVAALLACGGCAAAHVRSGVTRATCTHAAAGDAGSAETRVGHWRWTEDGWQQDIVP